ncbi:MAG: polymer-forming cytoskeletal protein [Saprospiraceae bacterium]|nr:polymer-forming cytoskeletal protein [Saprospiraceae bacterium]
MFGNNKAAEDPKKSANALPSGTTLNALAKGTVVEGSVRCDSDLRVDGTIKGKLICKAKVIIGPTGTVEGEIQCQNAVIEGRFKGILSVSELLNVRETAEVDGEITTNKLLVQSGARFNVACKMETGSPANGAAKSFDVKSSNDAAQVAGGKAEVRN